ncbi:ribosomal protein S10 domain-containing protein [Tuber brumale]|nr:ribosomal protein S10 domain-containing protein [Tuber brumale]
MLTVRLRSAVTRVWTIRRPLGVCSVLPRSNFSTVALLRQKITEETSTSNPGAEAVDPGADLEPRIPLSIQSVWYRPFKRKAEHGLPVCNLQIRSYNVRNLEFMCDFALRAAYYLNLPASGPVPLPRKTERWTVPRGHFVHKKSQENFERVTYKRLIQIKDGHPETVEIWLAYLKKHQFYGTGMKANVWGFEELGVGKRMNVSLDNLRDVATKPKWAHSGVGKTLETAERAAEILNSPEYRALANTTNVEEAEREVLQAAPLETIVGLEGAPEAEVEGAIQKVEEAIQKVEEAIQKMEEEAMKAEESREEAEVNDV